MLSSSCTHGVRAIVYLTSESRDGFVPVRRIAEALGLSPYFLAKVFHSLSAAGLIETYRGPNGGAKLSRPASEISVHDVIVALDGPGVFRDCLLGLPGCGEKTPCPVHSQWADVRSRIEWTTKHQDLESMAKDFMAGDTRLGIEL